MFNFQQVTDGVVGVSKFGILIDPGTHYHDVLLTEQLLPVMGQISSL